jgi:glycerol-3-phosphate dehydrogenase (NAD(P)+)
MANKIGIIGSGSWATALAKILTDNGQQINWWVRNEDLANAIQKRHHNPQYLSSAYFDVSKLNLSTNAEEVIKNAEIVVICIPSAYLLPAIQDLPKNIFENKKIISAIKGILPNDEHQLLNEYLEDTFNTNHNNYFTVMGPCHAEEVAAEKLSYLTFSGVDIVATTTIASYFKTYYLNTVVNPDIWGTQYAAVLKNIYAVGAGIAHGLDYGDNFLSVYIANAADEMVGFLKKMSATKVLPEGNDSLKTLNYASSVYLGDLLVTCYSPYSRNRTFGNMIGKGYSVKVAQLEMNMVAEGYPASNGLFQINQTLGANMPITDAIYNILWQGQKAATAFKNLEKVLK